MSQGFQKVELTDSLKDSLPKLMSNDEAAISCNAAASFPTKNLKDGMLCFRTDEKKLYQRRGSDWVQLAEGGSVDEALKKYLPLTGGTLTGGINLVNQADIWLKDNDNKPMGILFATANETTREVGITSKGAESVVNGPSLILNASDSPKNPSSFRLTAKNDVDNTAVTLKGDNLGNLTWGSRKLGVDATTTQTGTVLLATAEEVKAGTDSAKAVTPKALKEAGIGEVKVSDATESIKGIVELATSAEVATGTDSTRAITPKSLKDAGIVKVDLSKYLPLTGGTLTGALTATSLTVNGKSLNEKLVKAVSISGKVITFTFNDGSTQQITTQDTVTTNTSNWSVSKGTNGWARDNSTGFTIQWIFLSQISTYPSEKISNWNKTFKEVWSAVAGVAKYPSDFNNGSWFHVPAIRFISLTQFGLVSAMTESCDIRVVGFGIT